MYLQYTWCNPVYSLAWRVLAFLQCTSAGYVCNVYGTCLPPPPAVRQELTDECVLEELKKSKAISLEKDHLV